MIELDQIRFAHAGHPPVLDGIDLTVDEGELVVVCGRTGSGKSTLLGVVTGLVPRFTGGLLSGDVRLDGRSILDVPPRDRAHEIGYVGQDPLAGFVTDTVEEELAFGMEQLGLPATTMRRRVEETLDLLGIADLRARALRTLSGGQQQRVAIGSVLTMHPRLLVLDEPTSALDPTAAEEVLASLTRLVQDTGISVLLAEHRLERVLPFADEVALLDGHGGLRVGAPAEVLDGSVLAPPILQLGRVLGWSPAPLTVRDARRAARGLDLPRPDSIPAPASAPYDAPLVRARGVDVLLGHVQALRGADLELSAGQVTALMGRNGAGKSTLMWVLQGTRERRRGTVEVDGADPARLSPPQRRSRVGLVPQTASDLLYLETVAQECATADAGAEAPPGTARALLERLAPGIEDAMHPRDLSEGQRLALVLAIVLTAGPRVVLLDEPTRGLDGPAKQELAVILRDLATEGRTVLVATHDVEFVVRVADQVVVMAEGEVVSAGPTEQVVAESPAFASQVHKVLGSPWLTVDEVVAARREADRTAPEVRA